MTADLAREWAAVPAYGDYLDRVLGPGALDDFMARLADSSDELLGVGRRLFERWLDVRVAAAAA